MKQLLYKFRSLENKHQIVDILTTNKLWHAEPGTFEDKLDCVPNVARTATMTAEDLEYMRKLGMPRYEQLVFSGARVNRGVRRRICTYDLIMQEWLRYRKTIGVCSLADTFNDVRLWEKYAKNGSGIAIEFEVERDLNEIDFLQVEYSDNHSKVRLQDFTRAYLGGRQQKFFVADAMLAKKRKVFSFEHEVRHIVSVPNISHPVGTVKRVLVGQNAIRKDREWLHNIAGNIECVGTQFIRNKVEVCNDNNA